MGDVAMLVPVVERLHAAYPKLSISVVTKPFFTSLFSHLPYVNCIGAEVKGKHKGLLGLYKLANELPPNIDVVADMHEVLRSKFLRSLLRWKAKKVAVIDKLRNQKKQLTALQPKDIQPLPSVFEAYAKVLSVLQLPIQLSSEVKPTSIKQNPEVLKKLGIQNEFTRVGFAPFAAHQPKVLGVEKSKELIECVSNKSNTNLLLFGGGTNEIEQLNKLAEGKKQVYVVAGKLSFKEELSIIASLDLMISMDSGNGHLAAMFGKPVITIWGATHPYAGFTPFNQPEENQFTPDLAKFPFLPTSIYGNKMVEGYENAMQSISISAICNRALEIIEA